MNLNLNWAPLLIAAVLGGWAVADHIHQKAPRRASVLGGIAFVFIIAGVPPLLALIKQPLRPGMVMVLALVTLVGSLALMWHDIIKGGHKKPLFGRQGKAHHYRPQYETIAFAVSLLVVLGSLGAVTSGFGGGFSQTVNTITRQQG